MQRLLIAAILMVITAAAWADAPRFTAAERDAIAHYYQDATPAKGKGKGPKSLPPGIAKKLARGGRLPPGIAKRGLPQALEVQLPPPPAGHERVVVDGRVLLVEIATQVIHDILTDVIVADGD